MCPDWTYCLVYGYRTAGADTRRPRRRGRDRDRHHDLVPPACRGRSARRGARPRGGELATARRISIPDAERLLHRTAATETLAAQRLLDSGVEPNFTLEQAQVTACIRDITTAGGIPTRATFDGAASGI
jgi:hypothetical protein